MNKILLVEDIPDLVALYHPELIAAGFEVTVVTDGLEAMKFLHQSKPDLVVLDLMLPKLNGASCTPWRLRICSPKSLTSAGLTASRSSSWTLETPAGAVRLAGM